MLKDIASGSRRLELDPHPRLVVFGYDADQRSGTNWEPHREKLDKLLGHWCPNVFEVGLSKILIISR